MKRIKKSKKEINKSVQLVFNKIYFGDVSEIKCPYCDVVPLRFSYTYVEPDQYGIWISCKNCGGEAHLNISGRPPGFNKKFVIREFQERDEKAKEIVNNWWADVSNDNKS
jgi:hypothetical protein